MRKPDFSPPPKNHSPDARRDTRLTRAWATLALGGLLFALALAAPVQARAHSCVWKVTSLDGHKLYLAGSVHALRSSDWPLPASYEVAFAASQGVAFETDPSALKGKVLAALAEGGTYPKGTTLKDHVDPRTYAYVMRVAAQVKGAQDPEATLGRLKPWALALKLHTEGMEGVSTSRGVDPYFAAKAEAAHKPVEGLVPFRQHVAVFAQMNDHDSEVYLLYQFIHLDTSSAEYQRTVAEWRRGDLNAVNHQFDDAPSIRQRILTDRNLTWLPRIEGFLRSNRTWMVVAGAAHMAGPQGLPALLQARGYLVEQL